MESKNLSRAPVIVGVGELIDRPDDPVEGLEPIDMLVKCAEAAERDAGVAGLLRKIDTVHVVRSMSWPYKDLPGLLARRLRARHAETTYGPFGGESPVRQLVELADDIAGGYSDVALLAGAEATRTLMKLAAKGIKPNWSEPDLEGRRPTAVDFVSPESARYGLAQAVDVYPLYENACRRAWGQTFSEAQSESGRIWANNSKASAVNPCAWGGREMNSAQIVEPSETNRPVAWPYQKFMVSNISVNQASAIMLTSLGLAREMGIPDEHMVYVGAGAGCCEPSDFLARDRYDHAPALELTLTRALELNNISVDEVDLFELYSCFPIVPKLARRVLGLSADHPTSVAGGLTFFGGPSNNYMTHAIAAMTRALRKGDASTGLLHGNGEYVTKHHAALLSSKPPREGVVVANENMQAVLDTQYPDPPELIHAFDAYEGAASIETFTVTFDRKGEPDRGIVIARTPAGQRVLGRVTELEPDTLAWLVDPANEPVGMDGFIYDGQDGLLHWGLTMLSQRPAPAVTFEQPAPHVALVTINRPEKRNSVNGAVARSIAQYVKRIEENPDIRVAILTGAGGEAFSAGADLSEVSKGRAQDLSVPGYGFAGFVSAQRKKPWIAAVSGFALGGGTELTLACDLAIAGESASFGLPEVKRSLIAAAGGVHRAPRIMPPRVAMELLLTGEPVSSRDALAYHLVNRVVPDDAVVSTALELAEKIVRCAPLAVGEARCLIASTFDDSDVRLFDKSVDAARSLLTSDDAREGRQAFFEKRAPQWSGR